MNLEDILLVFFANHEEISQKFKEAFSPNLEILQKLGEIHPKTLDRFSKSLVEILPDSCRDSLRIMESFYQIWEIILKRFY